MLVLSNREIQRESDRQIKREKYKRGGEERKRDMGWGRVRQR